MRRRKSVTLYFRIYKILHTFHRKILRIHTTYIAQQGSYACLRTWWQFLPIEMRHDTLQMRVRQIENGVGRVLTLERVKHRFARTIGEMVHTTRFVLDPITLDPPSSSTQANADENAFVRSESVKSSTLPSQATPPEIYNERTGTATATFPQRNDGMPSPL